MKTPIGKKIFRVYNERELKHKKNKIFVTKKAGSSFNNGYEKTKYETSHKKPIENKVNTKKLPKFKFISNHNTITFQTNIYNKTNITNRIPLSSKKIHFFLYKETKNWNKKEKNQLKKKTKRQKYQHIKRHQNSQTKQSKQQSSTINFTYEGKQFTSGRWRKEEHKKFIDAIIQYGNDWRQVQKSVGTRTSTQARSHAQKFFEKLKRSNLLKFNVDFTKNSLKNLHDIMEEMSSKEFQKTLKILNSLAYERESNGKKRNKEEVEFDSSDELLEEKIDDNNNIEEISNNSIINEKSNLLEKEKEKEYNESIHERKNRVNFLDNNELIDFNNYYNSLIINNEISNNINNDIFSKNEKKDLDFSEQKKYLCQGFKEIKNRINKDNIYKFVDGFNDNNNIYDYKNNNNFPHYLFPIDTKEEELGFNQIFTSIINSNNKSNMNNNFIDLNYNNNFPRSRKISIDDSNLLSSFNYKL